MKRPKPILVESSDEEEPPRAAEESPLTANLPQELTDNVRSYLPPPRDKVMANRATRKLNSQGWGPERFWNTPGETNGVVDLNKVPDWTLEDILAHLKQVGELLPSLDPGGTERKQTAVVNQVKKAVANSEDTQHRVLTTLYPTLPTVHLFKWGGEIGFYYKTLLFTSFLPWVPAMALSETTFEIAEGTQRRSIDVFFYDPANPTINDTNPSFPPWASHAGVTFNGWEVTNREEFMRHDGFGKIKEPGVGIPSILEQPARGAVEDLSMRFFKTAKLEPRLHQGVGFDTISVDLLVGALIPDGVAVRQRTVQLHETAKVRVVDAAV